MRIVYLTHSLVSDWNHGNAHFLRGVLSELAARGWRTLALEPAGGWSRTHLRATDPSAEEAFAQRFPHLAAREYASQGEVGEEVEDADLVIVHEWTSPELVAALGRWRARGARFTLLFHDTHHRAVSSPQSLARYDLSGYDGVLAFGEALREVYLQRGWGRRVWTWHEAADTRVFHPIPDAERRNDVIWIGNWGDGERTRELESYLFRPVTEAKLALTVHGVRYPKKARARLAAIGARYGGWLANAEAPAAYARHRMTVHVPRRFYVDRLPGVPTIRVFEALACGVPLVCAPWRDCEGLFREGDYVSVSGTRSARAAMRLLKHDDDAADAYRRNGLEIIAQRHTCAHRVDQLLAILAEIDAAPAREPSTERTVAA